MAAVLYLAQVLCLEKWLPPEAYTHCVCVCVWWIEGAASVQLN